MFPCTALGKPLLKIGNMLTKAVLFHFIQLGCVPILAPFGDFLPFRLQRVKLQPSSSEVIQDSLPAAQEDDQYLLAKDPCDKISRRDANNQRIKGLPHAYKKEQISAIPSD
jgi:hypothetical protein